MPDTLCFCEQETNQVLAFIMRCLAHHTSINQCFFVVSNSRRRRLTELRSKLQKVVPIVPADLMEEHLCEAIMETAAAEAVKSTLRIPGLIHSLPMSILGFLLRACPGIIVVDHPRPQWGAGLRLHRDRKTFGEFHPHPQTRTVTLLTGIHHLHKISITAGLHSPHPHNPRTVTTPGDTTMLMTTETNSLRTAITAYLTMVGTQVKTTGMADSQGMI